MSEARDSIALSEHAPTVENQSEHGADPAQTSSQLPPTDGGRAAWRLLIAAFVFEALLWGFPLSFGVFQNYYSGVPEFKGNRYITAVGTMASGISYLGAPFIAPLIRRWSPYRQHMIWVGWPLCIGSLVAGSFANTLSTLILTQGIAYGTGFIILYYPILTMVDEYWVRRRGMAYGILCSASGVSGAVMPVILQTLLQKLGYRTTLRIVSGSLVVLTGPLIPLLKGRMGRQHTGGLRTDWSFLRSSLFWIYTCSNISMGLGYFFPSLYLPSYASAVGLTTTDGAMLLSLMSVSQVAGQFTFGYLSDKKLSINKLLAISSCVAATATLSLWNLAHSLPPLIVFAMLYSFFGAAYTAMWARIVTTVSDQPSASQAMFGLFNFGKGLGNVLASPIGANLLRLSSSTGSYSYSYRSYRAVVIFTGVCWLFSAGSLCGLYCRKKLQ